MTMRVTALAALAGSLFFVPVIMGQANAGVPDLKGAFGTTQSDVTLVGRGGRGGGGMGGRGGGGGHHFGGMGGGGRHFSGGGRHGGTSLGVVAVATTRVEVGAAGMSAAWAAVATMPVGVGMAAAGR
jgi:hypothetical protein